MELKKKARQLPESPGVYIMRDGSENIIYVGKAKSLRNRVSQYFQSSKRHAPKIVKMIELIRDFDHIHADTELEALLLECRMIKDLQPMFNSQLKNPRKYMYIWINMEDKYPSIDIIDEKQEKEISFGPYTSLGSVERAINVLKENLKLRQCKSFTNRKTGCLNSQLGYCIAPCTGGVSEEDYSNQVNEAVRFLQGKDDYLIKGLQSKMLAAAENLDFDKAAKYRDDIRALGHLISRSKTVAFSSRSKVVIAMERINELDYKLFIIKGSRVLYKERLKSWQDINTLKQHIVDLIKRYKKELETIERAEIDKGEIDQAQIVYSYLQNKKDCCYMLIPKSWLKEKDASKLEQGVGKLAMKLPFL